VRPLVISGSHSALSPDTGVSLGLIAGFYRGWIDTPISRTMDVLLSFPHCFFPLHRGRVHFEQCCTGPIRDHHLRPRILRLAPKTDESFAAVCRPFARKNLWMMQPRRV
jgi:hypothetical protein